MKKPDCASPRGPLAMSRDELARLFRDSQDATSTPLADPTEEEFWRQFYAEVEEEKYWGLVREEIELIRKLRDLHPTAPQLAMSADEITAFYRGRKPESRIKAQRKADLKIVLRVKPGRKAAGQDDKYRAFMTECLSAHPDNVGLARIMFIKGFGERFAPEAAAKRQAKRGKRRQSIEKTAENHWYRLKPTALK